jgi:outer membrane protein assembly factor BamB
MPLGLRFLMIALLACAPTAAQDWPQFRGPTGDGLSSTTGIPIHWTATEHVAWKTPIPGRGWSSPVLAAGRIYLTTATRDADPDDDSQAISLRALCIDAATGQIVWNVEVFRPDSAVARQMHTKNSLASCTPIIDGDRLYVHFGHMGTAALDSDGNIFWRQQRVTYPPVHGNGGSPALVDDLLVFSCDGASIPFIAVLDRTSGDVRWRTPRDTPARKTFSFSTPTVIEVDGASQIISAGSGFVGAYNPRDGREIWRVTYGPGYSVVPRPVFAHGLLFVCTGYDEPSLLAINPNDATGDATDDHIIWSRGKGAPLTPSLLVVGNELYSVTDNGVATCLDARSGDVRWTKRLGGDFSASPVGADGHIYFLNEEGTIYVIRAGKTYELLATNDLAERALASPAITNGAIIFRTESHLWRIEE